eukprot:TRINITY_DN21458_c0_g1_i1.p1 TRINITY_DN21458_c0_g1~~TRINITY_DN21458_c0_g1_i1.p1  ORF type:complete len:234 (+),score=30.15 TRINITY_DN21458_c0_g1_i1:69-704(+)
MAFRVASVAVAAIAACVRGCSGCSFDSAATYRTQDVIDNWEPEKVLGLWFVHAYKDPAQIGASCQTMTFTKQDDTELLTNFSVFYGSSPFTIVEHYGLEKPKATFRKTVTPPVPIPFEKLIGLPTSIVYTGDSSTSRYERLVLYSCYLSGLVTELNLLTRTPTLSDEDYKAMSDAAASVGLETSSLSKVDRSKCPPYAPGHPVSDATSLIV